MRWAIQRMSSIDVASGSTYISNKETRSRNALSSLMINSDSTAASEPGVVNSSYESKFGVSSFAFSSST